MQTFGAALKLKGSDSYYFSPVVLRDGVAEIRLLGKPVVFMDDMQAEGSSNLPIVYADFSRAYTILDRAGLTILRNPYKTSRYTIFEMTRRTGGDVTNFDAIKLNKCST
jgi:HK97 family phage major capsid protein